MLKRINTLLIGICIGVWGIYAGIVIQKALLNLNHDLTQAQEY